MFHLKFVSNVAKLSPSVKSETRSSRSVVWQRSKDTERAGRECTGSSHSPLHDRIYRAEKARDGQAVSGYEGGSPQQSQNQTMSVAASRSRMEMRLSVS